MNDSALRAALLGAWDLVAWQIDYSDGRDRSWPFGPGASGLLLYTPEGLTGAAPSSSSHSDASVRSKAYLRVSGSRLTTLF